MNLRDHLRDWATTLAAMAWPVFPLHPRSKVAAVKRWEDRATTDLNRIARCWAAGEWNIGLATGPANLVVVDCDVPKPGEAAPDGWNMLGIGCGADVLAALAQRAGGRIPDTWTVSTPTGGTHLYYRAPRGSRFRNTQGSGGLGWLVDTRAWGGYVVAPGSIRDSGGYELIDDHPPVELPDWLIQALTPKPITANSGRAHTPVTDLDGFVRAAIDGECMRVRKARSRGHNKALFIAACALGQLIGADPPALDDHTARTALMTAMRTHIDSPCDCTEREATNTITSGFRCGARNPRTLPTTTRQGVRAA
jgi:Bifunctional DNA primase/polymerase, N-terminal